MAIKRRDLLEANKLLAKHKLVKPGEIDSTALMLAVSYLQEKRDGETDLDFDTWLDQDMDEGDIDEAAAAVEDGGDEMGDPTPAS